MKAKRKAKVIALLVAVAVLLGVAAGRYFAARQPEGAPEPASSQPEASLTASNAPEQGAPRGQGAVSDSLILLEGGAFTMGSPDSERQRQADELFHEVTISPFYVDPCEVSQQDMNNNVYPALAGHVEDMEQYDVVILGYPTWWSTMPMPVFTFLDDYDLSGKLILPFSSNGGTRFGDSISDLSKMEPDAYVGQGFEYTYSGGGGLADDLGAWLVLSGIGVE